MGKVKDTSYFVVQGWMLNQLHLKGNTLQVFAIIHGFSHSEDNEYKGSLQYLCEFTGASRSTVIRSLTELQERGYIDKREAYENGVKFNRYKSSVDMSTYFDTTGVKMTPPPCQNDTTHHVKMTPHNMDYNTNHINPHNPPEGEQQKPKRKRKSDSAEDVEAAIKAFGYPESTNERLREWLEVRNAKRTPNTVSAIQKCIKTLPDMARKSNLGIDAYLDQVIMRGWAAFYEIKAYQPNNGAYSRNPEPPAPQYREAK